MINEYLEYQAKVKNLSARTVNEYRKELKVFVGWATKYKLRWSTLTKEDVDAFVMSQHDEGMKPTTIKKRITVVRNLLQWATNEGMLSENVAKYVQSPKNRPSLPKTANVEKLDEYLSTPVRNDQSARIHVMVALMLESGLRLSEALAVRWEDLNQHDRSIKVRGKGGKERIAFFGQRTFDALALMGYQGETILNFSSERQCRRELTEEVGDYVEGIHPHMLRHTFATAMVNNGAPLKDISVLMGHTHAATTEIYTRVAVPRLAAVVSKYGV